MRSLIKRTIILKSIRCRRHVANFKAPAYKPIYADVKGTFVAAKEIIGFEALEWSFSISSSDGPVIIGSLAGGNNSIIIVEETYKTDIDGSNQTVTYTLTGPVSYEPGDSKSRERKDDTFSGVARIFSHIDNGLPITVVDTLNDEYLIAGVKY